jgi:hypothetical protein
VDELEDPSYKQNGRKDRDRRDGRDDGDGYGNDLHDAECDQPPERDHASLGPRLALLPRAS